MLGEVCAEIRNYFLTHREEDIHSGEYTISNGTIDLSGLLVDGQYFRIVGSRLNDGVYQYPVTNLVDEQFKGSIWAMSVPQSFIELCNEIDEWRVNNAQVLDSPYSSESFGGYSYTKAQSYNGKTMFSWVDQFATRLNAYRRLSVL